MSLEAIQSAIPHRDPFLLLDEIVDLDENRIVCRKTFSGDEFWYRGHYPDFPLTPGVLLCEAAMQAGAVLLAQRMQTADGRVPVATGADRIQFKRMVFPGDTVTIETEILDEISGKFYLKARVLLDGKVAVRLEFACALVPTEQIH
ncbi:MAG: beta-hydroxyacyl-ACP dehydratase [Pirellulales bacterium]|nr:beta-hydroxyacyl-ACP dehydratase [Pirellulales bacterium]